MTYFIFTLPFLPFLPTFTIILDKSIYYKIFPKIKTRSVKNTVSLPYSKNRLNVVVNNVVSQSANTVRINPGKMDFFRKLRNGDLHSIGYSLYVISLY